MKKLLSKAIALVIVCVPGLALAAYNDVQLGVTNTVLSVNSATVTIAGTASTSVEQISAGATTFTLTFAAGSSITMSAPDITVQSMSTVQPMTTECASGVRTTTINASVGGTATVMPSATACSDVSSAGGGGGGTVAGLIGGGGGGGSSPPVTTVTKPVTGAAVVPTTPPSVSTTAVTFTSDLEVGAENSSVTALQTLLAAKGFLVMPSGVAMGYFGSLTRTAVQAYQRSMGIRPTGYVGPLTRAALNAATPVPLAATPAASPATVPASGGAFTRNLDVGATGADVKRLQVFLNTHGFAIAESGPGAPGSETERFGALTRSALAKFQSANGITPAVGYFGPKTRAAINAMAGN